MRLTLRNGFAHPSNPFITDDEVDAQVEAAAQRSVVVQGVRCVRMVAGQLVIEFHDGKAMLTAQADTRWPATDGKALAPVMKQREGGVSVVTNGFAYHDMIVEKAA